jgi:hypothetical protein
MALSPRAVHLVRDRGVDRGTWLALACMPRRTSPGDRETAQPPAADPATRGRDPVSPTPRHVELAPRAKKQWAFLFYLCGDHDSLEKDIEENLIQLAKTGASPDVHVVIQRDRPYQHGGAQRFVLDEASVEGVPPAVANIGAVNTGSDGPLLDFLTWAVSVCPSERVALVVGGMGLFAPGSVSILESRPRLFSICDDQSSADALDILQLRKVLDDFAAYRRVANEGSAPDDRWRAVDVLAFDMCHIQFLEVAYEIEHVVHVLVASQTFVPPQGWAYDELLGAIERACADPNGDRSAIGLARVLVDEGAKAWAAARRAQTEPYPDLPSEPALSALDLSQLGAVARAFDAMMMSMLGSLGDPLVWWARDRVLQYIAPRRPRLRIAASRADLVYDLGSLMTMVGDAMRDTSARPVTYWLSDRLLQACRTDRPWLYDPVRAHLESSVASVAPDAGIDLASLDACFEQPTDCAKRPSLLHMLDAGDPPDLDDPQHAEQVAARLAYKDAVERVLRDAVTRTRLRLRPWIQQDLMQLGSQEALASQLGKLANEVVHVLGMSGGFVVARGGVRLSGVSIYRPEHLEEVAELNYLDLAFHDRIHWAAYLAASNLIAAHPRALWRLVSSVMQSAASTARAEIMRRLVGPDAVSVGLSAQLRTLQAPTTLRLSLEPTRVNVAEPGSTAVARTNDAYRLRLDAGIGGATIAEQEARVYGPSLMAALKQLDDLLAADAVGPEEFAALRGLGSSLGEDIMQNLVERLDDERKRARERLRQPDPSIHLQLQIPPELMRYPWELMCDRKGWLGERFALGRQVFTDSRAARWTPGRPPGPLRILVIGDPVLPKGAPAAQLDGARDEAQAVVKLIEKLGASYPGLVDFEPDTDAWIRRPLTGERFRNLLRTRPYDIVHYAGHALFDEDDPACSRWLLSDVHGMTALNIRNTLAWLDTPPRLVFANACEAAMDRGRGDAGGRLENVSGLATAFINEGVSAYIAPLWPIGDGVAKRIAIQFYCSLLLGRTTVGDALKRAKLDARSVALEETKKGIRPVFGAGMGWASLLLYGDPATSIVFGIGAAGADTRHPDEPARAASTPQPPEAAVPTMPFAPAAPTNGGAPA